VETLAPFKEVIDEVIEKGGDAVKYCYQCGKCDTVCPWNNVRQYALYYLRQMPPAVPPGCKADR